MKQRVAIKCHENWVSLFQNTALILDNSYNRPDKPEIGSLHSFLITNALFKGGSLIEERTESNLTMTIVLV